MNHAPGQLARKLAQVLYQAVVGARVGRVERHRLVPADGIIPQGPLAGLAPFARHSAALAAQPLLIDYGQRKIVAPADTRSLPGQASPAGQRAAGLDVGNAPKVNAADVGQP